jgi:hypothetical protein
VLASAVERVSSAFAADPYQHDAAIQELQELALTMRTVAGKRQPDESLLLVEVASLVDQTDPAPTGR